VSRSEESWLPKVHATTIIMVRKDGKVVIAGDGQASMGQTVMMPSAQWLLPCATDGVVSNWNPP